MGEKKQLQMSVPEAWSEELWELQGRVKALEGFLRWAASESYVMDVTVKVNTVASIMGINLTEEGGN